VAGKAGPQQPQSKESKVPPAPNAEAPQPAQLTMFPHSQTAPYWISGQLNVILQGNPSFRSPYEGPNSFRSKAEDKTSILDTLYLGYQPHRNLRYNTDLIVNVEETGGRGLSDALGLAGFSNLDVVRNPDIGKAPYLARAEIHQTIGLTSKMAEAERGPFSLATQTPARRIEIRVGKYSLPDIFDVNEVASDSHLQFMNWTADDDGAWDYAADTRGYTVGGAIEYDEPAWQFRYGIFAMPIQANGDTLDWAFSRASGQNWEFDWLHSLVHGRNGAIRILGFANRAHMGNYRQAVQNYFAGRSATPDILSVERFGTLKYGLEWDQEQDLTANFRVGGRVGWNDDQEESFAYTEVGQTAEAAADYSGDRWRRPQDKIGIAFVSNAIKKDHQNYLKNGGLGFLLGDGGLNYGRENIVESYYNLHAWRGLFYALDLQHINNPGYNRDRGPVWVFSLRGHVDF
jgi:high affinity Mn2+ porin